MVEIMVKIKVTSRQSGDFMAGTAMPLQGYMVFDLNYLLRNLCNPWFQ